MSATSLDALVAYLESLDRASVHRMDRHYTEDAYFKDPFNEVHGVANIKKIFDRMFEQVEAPRFVILQRVFQGGEGFLLWDMHFHFRGSAQAQRIHGTSHIKLAPDGRVCYHRDYWDTGEELYGKIPGLRALFRWLRRRAG